MTNHYSNVEHQSTVVMNDDLQIRTRLTKHKDTKPCLQILRIPLTMAKLAGLYYDPVHKPCRVNVSFTFCVCLLVVIFYEFFRMFFIYEAQDGFASRMFKFLMHAFLIQELIGNLIFVCRTTPRMRKFFKDYDVYRGDADVINDDHRLERGILRRILIFCLLVGPIRLTFCLFHVIYPSTAFHYFKPYYNGPPEEMPYAAGTAFAASRLFLSYNDMVGTVFILSVCHLLCEEFDLMTSQLEKFSREDYEEDEGAQIFNNIRHNYLRLCKLVETLDGALGPIVLVTCFMDLLSVTFHVLPLMLNKPLIPGGEHLTIIVVVVSGFDRCCHLGGLIYSGVSLTTKSRRIQPLLMRLDVSSMTRSSYQVAQLFLLKVAYDHVGLTAWGLLNINKPFVVTLVSLGLTYTVILGRFGLTFGDKAPDTKDMIIQVVNATAFNYTMVT